MRRVFQGSKRESGFTLVELVLVVFVLGTLVLLGWPRVESAVNKAKAMECDSRIEMIARAKTAYGIDHLGHMSIATDEDWDVFNMYFWQPIQFRCARVTTGTYDSVSLRNLYVRTVCPYCTVNPVQ